LKNNRFCLLILLFLFIPFIVKAEECSLDNISIEQVEIINKSDGLVQKSNPIIDKNRLLFDIKLEKIGSIIEYKLIIKNNTDNDYKLETNYSNEYFDYMISTKDYSNIIKRNETNEVLLRVSYVKNVPLDLLNDNDIYDSHIQLLVTEPNDKITNPSTGRISIFILLLFVLLLFIIVLLFKRGHNYSLLVFLITLFAFTSISVYAMCNFSIDIDIKVEIPSTGDKYIYTINKYDESIGPSSYVWLDRNISDQIIKYNSGLETNKNIYLKHKLVDNKVVDSYVEFTVTEDMENNNPGMKRGIYSLRGSVGNLLVDNYVNPYYNDNLDVLRLAFGNDLSYCTDEGTYYVCNISGLNVYVDSNGCVGANDGSWYCDFYYDGNSACFE